MCDETTFFLRNDTFDKLPEWVYAQDNNKNIAIYVNSTGGDVLAAIEAVNLIKEHMGNVTTIINGCAESAALLIAISGDVGLRRCFRNSWGMAHAFSTVIEGDYYDLKDAQKHHDILHSTILDIYSRTTNLPRAITERTLFNRQNKWLTPDEMLKLNMIDEIIHD